MRAALLALLLLVPATARAATTEEIFAAYARGDYEQAAKVGEAAHTAPGYAIAARAVLADDVLRDKPCLECLERAERLSRQAVAADPRHAFGQIWLAVSLGYQSRITGVVKARLRDAPGQSKLALDAAITADPGNPYAISALGGWHIEIVRGGGATLARLLYGAREDQALALFDRAIKLAPGNVAVRYQIALSLLGFDDDKYRARILTELRAAVAGEAATAYEKEIKDRANELLGLVNRGAQDVLAARVRKYQGYPD
jgi:tetratricopeptide (TPR) repeat protein